MGSLCHRRARRNSPDYVVRTRRGTRRRSPYTRQRSQSGSEHDEEFRAGLRKSAKGGEYDTVDRFPTTNIAAELAWQRWQKKMEPFFPPWNQEHTGLFYTDNVPNYQKLFAAHGRTKEEQASIDDYWRTFKGPWEPEWFSEPAGTEVGEPDVIDLCAEAQDQVSSGQCDNIMLFLNDPWHEGPNRLPIVKLDDIRTTQNFDASSDARSRIVYHGSTAASIVAEASSFMSVTNGPCSRSSTFL